MGPGCNLAHELCSSEWANGKGSNRVNRGGSWNNTPANARVANRNNWQPFFHQHLVQCREQVRSGVDKRPVQIEHHQQICKIEGQSGFPEQPLRASVSVPVRLNRYRVLPSDAPLPAPLLTVRVRWCKIAQQWMRVSPLGASRCPVNRTN